jgi:regulatory protein
MFIAMKKPSPKHPTPESLHQAALAHLARYAATEAGLLRVLDRRVQRWAQGAGDEASASVPGLKQAVRDIVARLAASGAVSDKMFAAARARSLRHAGKSGRAISAHLAARGVAAGLTKAVTPRDQAAEAASACIHVRRRRLGAFRTAADTPERYRRELASLARAGFSQDVARQALAMPRTDAEAVIAAYRASLA